MQLLNAVRIAGNTARLVETRNFNIVNGAFVIKQIILLELYNS